MNINNDYKTVICSIAFLIMHLLQMIYYTRKSNYICVPYFTDLLENFKINILCRHFILMLITFQYSILFFENEFSFTYIFGSLSCIFLTGVLVHTLSENSLSRKLHFMYAFFGLLFGFIFNICNIVKHKVNPINIFLFIFLIFLSVVFYFFNSDKKTEIFYPISENLLICSFIPIYFDVYWDFLTLENSHLIAILYCFVYFLSYTEIRYDPKGTDTKERNKYEHFYYRRQRDVRMWYHNLLIVIDVICIIFNINQISVTTLEITFFNKVDVLNRNQFVRGVGGYEITIYEPDFII